MFLDNEKRFNMPLSVHSCVRLAYEQPGSPQEQPKLMFADGFSRPKNDARAAEGRPRAAIAVTPAVHSLLFALQTSQIHGGSIFFVVQILFVELIVAARATNTAHMLFQTTCPGTVAVFAAHLAD